MSHQYPECVCGGFHPETFECPQKARLAEERATLARDFAGKPANAETMALLADPKVQAVLKGTKHDGEKPDLSLFSTIWLFGVGQVLTFGKKKYAAHNWRQGIQISRLMAAALRHILAFNAGQDKDPETGLSHLDHASCCLMFARELIETRRKEVDDRFKVEAQRKEGTSAED